MFGSDSEFKMNWEWTLVFDPMTPVAKLQQAFNDHDVESMAENLMDDIKWLSIVGDSLVIEASDRGVLKEGMQGTLKQFHQLVRK